MYFCSKFPCPRNKLHIKVVIVPYMINSTFMRNEFIDKILLLIKLRVKLCLNKMNIIDLIAS